jgi:hypothetical protein
MKKHPAWCNECMRFGQVNIRETDPVDLNVQFWADFWNRCRIHGIVLNACGITAYYPTATPRHRKSPWLGNRDLFGELCRAAKAQGMRVLARIDPSRVEKYFYEAHPDWFILRPDGSISMSDDLYNTCINSPYYYEYAPSLFREIHQKYEVDGFFGNAWSGARELCHCPHCKEKFKKDSGHELPNERTPEWEKWRTKCDEDLWNFWDDFTKSIKPDTIWMGNHGVSRIADLAAMINADFQRRSGNAPMWVSGEMGKRMRTLTDAKKPYFHIHSANVASRHLARPEAEQRLWLAEAVAADSRPWFTIIGGTQWDKRQFEPIERFYRWHADNEAYLKNRESMANVVLLQSNDTEAYQGMYYALLRARIPFDLLHPTKITSDRLNRYQVLVLANASPLSASDCQTILKFFQNGGSLVATYETSLYAESGAKRENFGLSEIFGVRHLGKESSGPLEHSYMRLEDKKHPLLSGIENTDRTLFGGKLAEVEATEKLSPILTLITPYTTYPPEKTFPSVERTETSLVFVRETKNSRSVYFPGQVDRLFWSLNLPDHLRLIANSVRWAAFDQIPVYVEGPGLVDVHAYRQGGKNIQIHLVNLSSPDVWKTPVHELIPIGEQSVKLKLPYDKTVSQIKLLVSGKLVSDSIDDVHGDHQLSFSVPTIVDHEVAVVETKSI